MGKINMNELTKEQIQKAMACESVEELDSESLKNVAGGYCHRTTPCSQVFQ